MNNSSDDGHVQTAKNSANFIEIFSEHIFEFICNRYILKKLYK